ncbi:MAG: tetratricopeptide repeat protein [Thermoguttaceae bacterium]|jgi:tetratricopeptide (TPR) repeat protein|nr:tetratricopeptide repeat protein [Thermoguttaceae bacterium]
MAAHLERAKVLLLQRRYADAEAEAGLALAERPDDESAHRVMALCLLERERFDEATEHAQQAVALGPDVPAAHYTLAVVWARRNYLDRAEAAVREAIALDPDDADCRVLLGRILLARKRWEEALAAAEQAMALDPEHVEALNVRAEALRGLGRTGVAEEELVSALQVDPDDAWTHANLGWTALENGQRAQAMERFREALRLNPELEWARLGVVETLRAHNPLYRVLLRYFFWVGRLSTGAQWAVILGAYVGYRVVLEVARTHPALGPWLAPVIVAYLVFALGTWLGRPMMNLALRLHPFGRLALSDDERRGANVVGGFLLAAALAAAAYWGLSFRLALPVAIFCLGMVLPLAATFQSATPWPRKGLWVYTGVVALLGIAPWVLAVLNALGVFGPASDDRVLSLMVLAWRGFALASVLSLFAGNILMSISWKR